MRIASSRALYRAMDINTTTLISSAWSIVLFPDPNGDVGFCGELFMLQVGEGV